MNTLKKELRLEAYNNLRKKYDEGHLSYIRFSKEELRELFEQEFEHKPETSTCRDHRISNDEILKFLRRITIEKKIDEEFENVQKKFYQKVKKIK